MSLLITEIDKHVLIIKSFDIVLFFLKLEHFGSPCIIFLNSVRLFLSLQYSKNSEYFVLIL